MDIGGRLTNGEASGGNGEWHPPAASVREDGGELLSVLPAGTSAVALGPVASLDHALRIAGFLDHLERASPWWWADLLNQCELRWGETYAQLELHSHLEVRTLRNRKWVGGRFPAARRSENLTFGHYDALTSFPDWEVDDLVAWLEEPIREGRDRARSVAELREELGRRRGRPGGRIVGQGVPPAGQRGQGPAPSSVSPRGGLPESPAPDGGDLDPPWPGVETDATPRLAAWLAEGAQLLDWLRGGEVYVVKRLAARDVDASAELVAVLARAVRGG